MDRMLKDIRSRTGVSDVSYTGNVGGGADFPGLNTDITSFQKGASTYEKFRKGLYDALVDKSGQKFTQNVYMQMNNGLQYEIQEVLNKVMSEWAKEGVSMLKGVFLYDAGGNLVASWPTGVTP